VCGGLLTAAPATRRHPWSLAPGTGTCGHSLARRSRTIPTAIALLDSDTPGVLCAAGLDVGALRTMFGAMTACRWEFGCANALAHVSFAPIALANCG